MSDDKSPAPTPSTTLMAEVKQMDVQVLVVAPSNLCAACDMAFKRGQQDGWHPHHQSGLDLESASSLGCYICGTIQCSTAWILEPSRCRSTKFEYHLSLRSRDHSSIRDGLDIATLALGYSWTFQLWREPGPTGILQPYVPARSIDDPALAKLATTWLEACCQTHDACRILNSTYRPSRLINIIDAGHLRLISTDQQPPCPDPYVAFSHCWGKVEAIKLLRHNLNQFRAGLDVQQLPSTYQEAIRLCLKMGFHYIWIDSLCIVQDSVEDWAREAKDMKRVYEHVAFNLCSATASDSSGKSFLARDPKLLRPQRVMIQDEIFELICEGQFWEDITFCTLRSRGWVYQEWYLSRRSLILGKHQLWWHCQQHLACEIRPNGAPQVPGGVWWREAKTYKEAATPVHSDHLDEWNQHVKAYARTKLTRETDRLMAFSGIIQSFGQSRGITHEYLAGLWRCHLPAALCWHVVSPAARSAVYTAPSWSWASLSGDLYVNMDSDLLREPCYASVERIWPLCKKGAEDFLMGGVINISGYLFHVSHQPSAINPNQGRFSVPGDPHTGGLLFLDERSETENMISHLSEPDLGRFDLWLQDKASRKRMHLRDAQGQFFFLLLLDRGDDNPLRFGGLVLYQPVEQPDFFYRVGYMNWKSLPRGISPDQLPVEYSKRVILLL